SSGALALDVGGQDTDRRVHARAGIADRRPWLQRRRAVKPGQAHRAAGGLRDHVEALVRAVRTGGAEALDREVDEARIYVAERVVAEPEPLESSERVVLAQDIDLLHEVPENLAAFVALQIERDAALVRVEQHEVIRVDTLLLGQQPPPLLAHLRRF